MKSIRTSIITLLMVFAFVSAAIAGDDLRVKFTANLTNTDFSTSSQLDEAFSDSLSYYSSTGLLYNPSAANFYTGVRFTTPTEFVLEGINMMALGLTMTDNVQINLYDNNEGQPGTLISEVWNGTPTSVTGNFYVDFVRAEADYDTIAANTDIWVVIGPIAGFATGWTPIFDGSEVFPGSNLRGSTATNLDTEIGGDIVISAGGEFLGEFINYDVTCLYNNSDLFHFLPNVPVTLNAKIFNRGNVATPEAGTATITVTNSASTVVFTNSVTFGAIDPVATDSMIVTASETWTPTETDRYVAEVVVSCEEEEFNDNNNSYSLLQNVVEDGNWLGYDDDTFESIISTSAGNGHGVVVYPVVYPAKIDSMSWYFGSSATNVKLQVYLVDETSYSGPVWDNYVSVSEGWNTFAITNPEFPDGISISSGAFVGMYISDGTLAMPIDSDKPVSAENTEMPWVSFSYDSGEQAYYFDRSGNWGIRGFCSECAMVDLVFPTAPLNFGEVARNETHHGYFVIENVGGLDATISATLSGTNYNPDELVIINTFPMTIAANSVDSVEIVWTPGDESSAIQAAILTEHNDLNETSPNINGVLGTLSESGVDLLSTETIPDNYFLAQNHPNPFNPETRIQFGLPNSGHVSLTVYNVMGQEVARLVDSQMNAGTYAVTLNGSNLSSGIYFYSLEAKGFRTMKKMSLMK